MLIPIAPDIFINPLKVSVVEQVQGQLWVYVDGKAYLAKGDVKEVFDKIQSYHEQYTPDKWEGR